MLDVLLVLAVWSHLGMTATVWCGACEALLLAAVLDAICWRADHSSDEDNTERGRDGDADGSSESDKVDGASALHAQQQLQTSSAEEDDSEEDDEAADEESDAASSDEESSEAESSDPASSAAEEQLEAGVLEANHAQQTDRLGSHAQAGSSSPPPGAPGEEADDIPFTMEAPASYPAFARVVQERSPAQLQTIVQCIRTCNAIALATDNRRKLQV